MTDCGECDLEDEPDGASSQPWTFSLKALSGYILLAGVVSVVTAQAITGRGLIVDWLPIVLPLLTVAALGGTALILNSWD
jgi:hypothetical protein